MRTRSLAAVLWALLALAVVGGLISVTQLLRTPASPPAAAAPEVAVADTGVGGFAGLFLQAWLPAGQGTEKSLTPYMSSLPDLSVVQPNKLVATGTTPVTSTPAGRPGYWSVTVAVTVAVVTDGGALSPLGLRYYQVAVAACGTPRTGAPACPGGTAGPGYTVVSAPAVVSGPARYPAPGTIPGEILAASSPAGDTVKRFLTAFLTGAGELARYCAPCAPLAVPPMTRADLTELRITTGPDGVDVTGPQIPAEGTELTVHATARAVDTAGVTQTLSYPLRLVVRAGQWVVGAITAAPPLATTPSTSRTSLVPAEPSPPSSPPATPAPPS